mgnify:CR=1 FL=1
MPSFRVDTPQRSYEAIVERGCLSRISDLIPQRCGRIFVVTTQDVWDLHGAALRTALAGRDPSILFFPGEEARQIEANGPTAAGSTAMSLLADIFGAKVRSTFAGARSTRWGEDRYAHGAWSIGPESARAEMARPHHEKVLFAGEATADGSLMGAHGSGLRAAKEALAILGRT